MKRKSSPFMKIITLLFLVFLILYIMTKSGYYESKQYNKAKLTEEKINQFERDIKNGKVININDYYVDKRPDYSSFVSKAGKRISNDLSSSLSGFFTQFGKILKKLFW